ncbi:MAG: diguanylate cyclase domain-containing protein [Roseateles sp.]|uniref:diguanylate cyclase domain-containing protein n=1 Tax=Roseateles sp. TaxID=1971397 RepID=UPI004036C10A
MRFAYRFMRLLCLLLILQLGPAWVAATPAALRVDNSSDIALWPAVTLLDDPSHRLGVADVLPRRAEFSPHTGTPGNLGRHAAALWLHVPLDVTGSGPQQRVLEIDYPSLNRVEVYLVRDGQVVSQQLMGNELVYSARPLPSRTPAALLTLEPGRSELLIRVRTQSSMVLPITLRTPQGFLAAESATHLVQGILLGLALCMLIYSLAHYVSLRDPMFLQYTAMLVGNLVFLLAYFGVGPQYLWQDAPELSRKLAPLGVLLSVAAAAHFINGALVLRDSQRLMFHMMRVVAALALLTIALALLGVLTYGTAQTLAMVLGVGTPASVLPLAFIRVLRGERVAAYMLFGWTFYLGGAATLSLLIRGYTEPTVLAQYSYPASIIIEMAAWMGVLGLRVQAMHRSADRARLESEGLRALAQTDALTGLPNRRGLQDRLAGALPQATPQRPLAIYLLDLDGFKPVNDMHGHDVGDALLVAVGQRLRQHLRDSDVVARLGGDEFVVLADDLTDNDAAAGLGQKLLAAFDDPFVVLGHRCKVGLTIGYAMAPQDGQRGNDLLKRADAAMYAGKRAGRHCMRRAEPAKTSA